MAAECYNAKRRTRACNPTGEPSRHLLLEVNVTATKERSHPKVETLSPITVGIPVLSKPRRLKVVNGTVIRAVQRSNARDYDGVPPSSLTVGFDK